MTTSLISRRDVLARLALALAAATAPGLLASCAGLGGPTVITLGETELAGLVARAFPLQRRVLELVDVQLSAPQLRLLPAQNRLSVALALRTQERLLGNATRGRLAFECALRYEAQDASLRLAQVRVQQLALDGDAPPAGPTPVGGAAISAGTGQRLAQALAERLLENLSVYRLPPERQASLRQLGLAPGAVTVTSRGVEITLAHVGG